jgi:DNA-binding LacI/PurR family transcriptional regulator
MPRDRLPLQASFDGIVAASDLMPPGGIRALRRKGIDVPGKVSAVGYAMLLSGYRPPGSSSASPAAANERLVVRQIPGNRVGRQRCRLPDGDTR